MSEEEDAEEKATKLARLEELKRKYENDEDLTDEEEAELEAFAEDPDLPVDAED